MLAANGLVSRAAACALSLATAAAAGAQALVPVGAEFPVDTYTTGDQVSPSLAMASDASFVVVWQNARSGDTSASIQGQRYASDGSPAGPQLQVSSHTTADQEFPVVAAAPDGRFVVVWTSEGGAGTDTSSTSVQARLYDSSGSPLRGDFQVNSYTPSYQAQPAAAMGADGRFVVVWQGTRGGFGPDTLYSIQGQRFASDGSKQGGEFQVNSYTANYQMSPSVSMRGDGDFVVVWHSYGSAGTDTSSASIQGQRYASDGARRGREFQVNTYTWSQQTNASVQAMTNGSFVVVWESYASPGSDSSTRSIQGRRFTSDCSAQGQQFQVNSYTTNVQRHASVAVASDGRFVVAWGSDGSYDTDTSEQSVQAQRYASDGSPQGQQFQVNSHTASDQSDPSVAAAPRGDFAVAWASRGSPGTDRSRSIQARRYDASDPVAARRAGGE
jgi:hypothetical protein